MVYNAEYSGRPLGATIPRWLKVSARKDVERTEKDEEKNNCYFTCTNYGSK